MPWELQDGASAAPRRNKRHLGITLLGAGGALVALLLIGVLMAVPFLVQRDVVPGTAFRLGDLRALTEIAIAGDGGYELALTVADARGAAIDPTMLNLSLTMEGHAMAPTPVRLERVAVGAYRAAGQLAMSGRWRFKLASDRGAANVVADYATSFPGP